MEGVMGGGGDGCWVEGVGVKGVYIYGHGCHH